MGQAYAMEMEDTTAMPQFMLHDVLIRKVAGTMLLEQQKMAVKRPPFCDGRLILSFRVGEIYNRYALRNVECTSLSPPGFIASHVYRFS